MADEKDITTDKDQEVVDQSEQTQPNPEEAAQPGETTENTEAKEESAEATEEAVVEEAPAPKPEDMRGPHDDFDWSVSNRNTVHYTEEETEKYLNEYENSLSSLTENEIVTGKITNISESDVILDINFKSDGLIALSEFRSDGEIAVGDTIEVYVEQQEDARGQLVLSRRKAKLLKAWESLVDSYDNGTIIKGTVISKTKGGLIVDAGGLETFLPGSQIDIKPIIDYDSYVGKTMEFKVVKINEKIKNAVVSHKALIESDLAEQREQIIGSLEKGQVLEGLVKNLTDFGAFMDLGGVDGLLYITDISWGRINHPNEVLELNQKINVVVLDFDENKKRISLGLKQLQPHPWDVLGEEINEGSTVKGRIVNIEDYGAFLEITPGVEGLIHVSEVTWSNQPINARDYFTLGQDHEAKVVTIDREDRKMSLSLKQLTKDPWSEIENQFPLESRHKGEVKNLTPYGVFVELEDGIGGMVHISDLSWTKRFSHPSEFTKVGEDIDVVILEIDKESRKLSLGHKQIEENPWDTFAQVFPVGSYHEATIVRKDDKGATVQMPYGLEAFAPGKHLRKEDNSYANVDETLTFKVIEFNRDDKRIIVSHLRYVDDIQREADDVVRKEKDQQRKRTDRLMTEQKSRVERTTLGELDVFSQLKEQLADSKAPAAKKEAPKKEEKEEVKEPAKAEEAKAEVPEAIQEAVDATLTPTPDEVVEKATADGTDASSDEKPAEKESEEPAEEAKAEEAKEEEVKSEEPAKEEEVKEEKASNDAEADDLKKIEGIGPKIQQLLNDADIHTFATLSESDPEKIKEILLAAGSRYKMFDPTTWPEQAKLAAAGEWDALKTLQDELDGGKRG